MGLGVSVRLLTTYQLTTATMCGAPFRNRWRSDHHPCEVAIGPPPVHSRRASQSTTSPRREHTGPIEPSVVTVRMDVVGDRYDTWRPSQHMSVTKPAYVGHQAGIPVRPFRRAFCDAGRCHQGDYEQHVIGQCRRWLADRRTRPKGQCCKQCSCLVYQRDGETCTGPRCGTRLPHVGPRRGPGSTSKVPPSHVDLDDTGVSRREP
jgi:hypothetical protein